MPTFPSNPTITSRLSTGSALTYTQMDTNFGNLTASIDSVISVSRTASYVDSSNVYYTGTSQSFWSASISSSTIGTATVSTLNVTNLTAAGTVLLNGGLTIGAGTITGNVTGSVFGTASWATQASTASYVVTANTASYVLNAVSSSFASTASYVATAQTASYVVTANTASYVLNAVSSSFASTASYVATAQTASSVSPLIQTVIISGSLFITGSPVRLVGLPTTEPLITGSLWLSGSGAGSATGSKYLMVFNG